MKERETEAGTFSLQFHALFFPDTQQSVLESEQKILRCLFTRIAGEDALPFCFFPPCVPLYPASPDIPLPELPHLEAMPAQICGGWLVRKINPQFQAELRDARASSGFQNQTESPVPADRHTARGEKAACKPHSAPRFLPAFPQEPCVLLGFAGEHAARLLGAYREHENRYTLSPCNPDSGLLRAEVWYSAELSVEIKNEATAFSARWSLGKPKWKARNGTNGNQKNL